MRASPLPKSPSHLLHVVPIMLRFLCHLAGASRPWHTVSVTSNLSHARLPETHVAPISSRIESATCSPFLRAWWHPLDLRWKDNEMRKGFTRKPKVDEPATPGKN